MRIFYEVEKSIPIKEANKLAKEYKEAGGYDYLELINRNGSRGIDWQHPERLKTKWVYVLEKKNETTGFVHESYPLYGCPHGIGKKCIICQKIKESRLERLAENFWELTIPCEKYNIPKEEKVTTPKVKEGK